MSLCDNDIDWSSLLSSTSISPPDISLKIIPEDGMDEEEVVVKAHRMFLSLLSPVFRVYLSKGGVWCESSSEVILKDVSGKAFKIMIDFFYKKDFKLSQKFTNLKDLFEILKVADRFQVDALVILCKKALNEFPMELNTVVDIVNTAKAYSSFAPFVTISEKIIKEALECLANKINMIKTKTTPNVLNFLAQSHQDDFRRLVNEVAQVEDTIQNVELEASKECERCGVLLFDNDNYKATHENDKCKVIYKNMVEGSRVVVTERSRFKYNSQEELETGHQGKIMKTASYRYTIKWDNEADILTYELSKNLNVPMRYIRS